MIISLKGNSTTLEQVTLEDAELICNLRNDPKWNRFLFSNIKLISIAEQTEWMRKNASKKDNFYFKIIDRDTGDFCGTIAIYDLKNRVAEFGRYVCTGSLQAVESVYLILKFGFDVMLLDKIYCGVASDNKKVWKQHQKYGFREMREEILGPNKVVAKILELDRADFSSYDYSFVDKISKRTH